MNQIIRFAGFGRLASDLQMDPALRKLMRLRFRARLRVILRGLKTPRGAVFFAVGAIMFVLWLGPSVVMVVVGASARDRFDPEVVRTVIPLALPRIRLLVGTHVSDPDVVAAGAVRILGNFRLGLVAHRDP